MHRWKPVRGSRTRYPGTHRPAFRAALVYAAAASLWILGSDLLLYAVEPLLSASDNAWLQHLVQPAKGVLFVILTTGFLYLYLRRQWRLIMIAKERAELMERLKATFLANMNHEIRTPLTAILGFAELMLEDPDLDARLAARHIHDSGRRLMHMLNTVLDYAQLSTNTLRMRHTPIDLCVEVNRMSTAWAAHAAERRLAFSCTCETTAPILFDGSVLRRILDHLVSNAVRFTKQGSVSVLVRASHGTLRIVVEDTGPGIDPDFIPYLFDEFQQASTGMGRLHEGSGLGLAVTKRLVDHLQGTITCDSRLGEGSRFTVTVPVHLAPHATEETTVADGTAR